MARLILLVAIGVVIYLLIRSFRRPAAPARKDEPATEDMVRCAYCGVHLPRGESIKSGGDFFCCVEHRDIYRK